MIHYDSTGKEIELGDKVRFRGQVYTIKDFVSPDNLHDPPLIVFNTDQHTLEIATEWSVDLVAAFVDGRYDG